jgi:hypothetical protein
MFARFVEILERQAGQEAEPEERRMRRHVYRSDGPRAPLPIRRQEDVSQPELPCGPSRPADQPGVLWRMFERT